MEFFPNLQTELETNAFIERMQRQFESKGFCYFAVDSLEHSEFIGFIGLSEQNFESGFTPCIDIGWRLDQKYWNLGYATEGAKTCLHFGFNNLKMEKICSIAPVVNTRSTKVMEKIGMTKVKEFNHPKLSGNEYLENCALYEISNINLKNESSR